MYNCIRLRDELPLLRRDVRSLALCSVYWWQSSLCFSQREKQNQWWECFMRFVCEALSKKQQFFQIIMNNLTSWVPHHLPPIIDLYSISKQQAAWELIVFSPFSDSSTKKKKINKMFGSIWSHKYTSCQCSLLYNGDLMFLEPLVMTNLPDEALIGGRL